ncbi:MAG: endopeptidase La, partial [Mycoplasmataceae bacterium]|nr:endopeptidase La [Mycoplasmataceae bacterium]
RGYTREAGVRDLQRKINTLARKMIVADLENDKEPILKIDKPTIETLLKKPPFSSDRREKKPQVGMTTGLAWSSVGGSTLPIEVTLFPGKGKLILTGSLKDVMKESASIALGYIKANSAKFGIDYSKFESNDIHVHVPEGATPKDGPSAGVTFTTSLISALTNIPVSPKVAMTGEITLRGNVLAIGGLKEKTLAAERMGIKKIFIPSENEKDIVDLAPEVKKNIEFKLATKYTDIFDDLFKK